MAEQLVRRRIDHDPRAVSEQAAPSSDLGAYRESIRQAQSCLEAAGKRLKRPEPEQADEVLNLLRAATAYLQQAVTPSEPRPAVLARGE